MSQQKSSKMKHRCQDKSAEARDTEASEFFAELEEDMNYTGPRMFGDEYYKPTKRKRPRTVEVRLQLTPAEISQLQSYIRWAQHDGSYYGPRNQFDNRHDRILEAFDMRREEYD